MHDALIGSTGFVGSTLARTWKFAHQYHSRDIGPNSRRGGTTRWSAPAHRPRSGRRTKTRRPTAPTWAGSWTRSPAPTPAASC